jgi:hypothetical protein
MTDAEADAVAARVEARLAPRLEAIEGAVRDNTSASRAHTRATGKLRELFAHDATARAARESVRLVTPPPDPPPDPPPPDPVKEAVVDLKVRTIRGVTAAPGSVIKYLTADPVRTLSLLGFLGGLCLDIATGSPVSTSIFRAFASLAAPSAQDVP